MKGLKHEAGRIQRVDLQLPALGEKWPSQVATVTSNQSLTPAALATELQLVELLRTERGSYSPHLPNQCGISASRFQILACK